MRDLYKELASLPKPDWASLKNWDFAGKPGSIIVGRVTGYTFKEYAGSIWSYLGGVIVETDDGEEVHVSADPPHIREQFERLGVAEGDRIGIKYLGYNPYAHRDEFHVIVDVVVNGRIDDWHRPGDRAQLQHSWLDERL